MKIIKPLTSLYIILSALIGCSKADMISMEPIPGATVVDAIGNDQIKQFVEDKDGYVWIVFGDNSSKGVFKTDGTQFIHYSHSKEGSLSSNKVNKIITDNNKEVWVATQKGIDKFNGVTFTNYPIDDSNAYVVDMVSSPDGRICIATRRNILELDRKSLHFEVKTEIAELTSEEASLKFDEKGQLWCKNGNIVKAYNPDFQEIYNLEFTNLSDHFIYDTSNHLYLVDNGRLKMINTNSGQLIELPRVLDGIASLTVNAIQSPREGVIVIETNNGNFCFDATKEMLYTAHDIDSGYFNLMSNLTFNALTLTRNDEIWGARSEGGFVHLNSEDYFPKKAVPVLLYLQNHNVTDMVATDRNIWILCDYNSLVTYDIQEERITDILDLTAFGADKAYSVSYSPKGYLITNKLKSENSIHLYSLDEKGIPHSKGFIKGSDFAVGAFDENGDLFAAGLGTSLKKTVKSESFSKDFALEDQKTFYQDNLSYPSLVRCLSDNSILICYTDHSPILLDTRTGETKVMEIDELSQVYFFQAAEDPAGFLYIASTDKGLYKYSKQDKSIRKINGIGDDSMTSILCDRNGIVYTFENRRDIKSFNPETGEIQHLWSDPSVFPADRNLIEIVNGVICLIGEDGIETFGMNELNSRHMSSRMNIILASGNNPLAIFSSNRYPNRKATIKVKDTNIGLNLILSLNASNIQGQTFCYKYHINGTPGGEIESLNNSTLPLYGMRHFKNKVTFSITNSNSLAESEPFTLYIKRRPKSNEIAQMTGVLLLILLAFHLVSLGKKRQREIQDEKLKNQVKEEINTKSIDYFANISHEFRTPLTLINGALSQIEASDSPDEILKSKGVIKRNTNRLLKLVSQMMDFNKLEHDMLKLKVSAVSISDILANAISSFEVGAKLKNIDIRTNFPDNPILGWADADKLEKIMYNLLSNALKYTSPGGNIVVSAATDKNAMLSVSVEDDGVGIPEDQIDSIFDRFYQSEVTRKTGGAGIGLYYTKSLVSLHHGTIQAKRKGSGDDIIHGTIFTVSIPTSENAFSAQEKENPMYDYKYSDYTEMANDLSVDETVKVNSNKPTVLLIDDDYEFVYYLKSVLQKNYNVHFRFDGASGLKKIEEITPDIIICDLMKAEMDGCQVCRIVKENLSLSHIPFIILSTKSSVEDQIRALQSGADSFVEKPFNQEYLLALIESQLNNRLRVAKMLGTATTIPASVPETLSSRDKAFMDKVYKLLEANLHDGDIDIDDIASSVGVSRSKFYYKIKALTGQTPNDFFTTFKLNYAKKMLEEDKYKISAIADMLGYSSASHFSNQFKKQFGQLPSRYRDQ